MVSFYDKATVYAIGETLNGKPRQNHRGGYYVYKSANAARLFVSGLEGPSRYGKWAILRCQAEGRYCRYADSGGPEWDKFAFAKVTPVEVVETFVHPV